MDEETASSLKTSTPIKDTRGQDGVMNCGESEVPYPENAVEELVT